MFKDVEAYCQQTKDHYMREVNPKTINPEDDAQGLPRFIIPFMSAVAAGLVGQIVHAAKIPGAKPVLARTMVEAAIKMVEARLRISDPGIRLSITYDNEEQKK